MTTSGPSRLTLVDDRHTVSVMSRGDHLRIQAILPRSPDLRAWQIADTLDDTFGKSSNTRFIPGTVTPDSVAVELGPGTSEGVGVWALPGIALVGDLEESLTAAQNPRIFSVRGSFGEKTGAWGRRSSSKISNALEHRVLDEK